MLADARHRRSTSCDGGSPSCVREPCSEGRHACARQSRLGCDLAGFESMMPA
jgi:hypothetical protein